MDEKTPAQANQALRSKARELRETSVVLRVLAATVMPKNRRILLEIREMLKKRKR